MELTKQGGHPRHAPEDPLVGGALWPGVDLGKGRLSLVALHIGTEHISLGLVLPSYPMSSAPRTS